MAMVMGTLPREGCQASLDDYRQHHETEKHWAARKQFLDRHKHLYPGRKMDQLVALSVVWSNIVFIGNRYGEQLTQKVYQMAEGIDIGEVPSYELVPGAKRSTTSDPGGQPKKKFAPRPRFEPVHFVVSTVADDKKFQKTQNTTEGFSSYKPDREYHTQGSIPQSCDILVTTSDHSESDENPEMDFNPNPYIYDPNTTDHQINNGSDSFMTKMKQDYSAKFESHHSNLAKDFRSNVLDTWKDVNKQGRKGIGFVKSLKKPGKLGKPREDTNAFFGHPTQIFDKSSFIKHLSTIVIQHMLKPKSIADSSRANYTHLLTQSTQACKTNPEYIYVPIKDIPLIDRPKFKNVPLDGFACEVRCQDIYLSTGYSWSKNGARDRAAELAIQLLQKSLDVVTVQRKFGHQYRNDVVACPVNSLRNEFPPSLKQDDSARNEGFHVDQHSSVVAKDGTARPWSEFILTENAYNAIGILNNSATFNKMAVEYRYNIMPNKTWQCSVYVQDHCLANGYGNKKTSKHAAATEAVRILRQMQPTLQKPDYGQSTVGGPLNNLKDFVIYGKSSNPVCALNDTAQFNKLNVEYVFERQSDVNWKCKVFMEQQFIAEAIGIKKTVKHNAAKEALNILKRTHPVMVNKLDPGTAEDAISRNQIRGVSNDEAYKQKIKEDNIGNQLLRKMGWTGGGLGKGGEGIAEPISVKEQYSREGLGLLTGSQKITKRDIEQIIRNYAVSCNQDDLTFSRELTNEERKNIHQIAQKYGLKSKSHGQGAERFLVVSRKRSKDDLIHQLRQEGKVGSYALVMPKKY